MQIIPVSGRGGEIKLICIKRMQIGLRSSLHFPLANRQPFFVCMEVLLNGETVSGTAPGDYSSLFPPS